MESPETDGIEAERLEKSKQATVRRELRRTATQAWWERFGMQPAYVAAPGWSRACPRCGEPYRR